MFFSFHNVQLSAVDWAINVIMSLIMHPCELNLSYSLLPLTHLLVFHGVYLVQQASPWPRLVYQLWSKRLKPEITQRGSTPAWDLPGTDGTQWGWRPRAGAGEENQRDADKVLGLSGEKSPLATDSPSKWRQSHKPSREWLANVLIPSFLPVCLHLMYEWSRERG